MQRLKYNLGDTVFYEGKETKIIGLNKDSFYDQHYFVETSKIHAHDGNGLIGERLSGYDDVKGWWVTEEELDEPQSSPENPTWRDLKFSLGDRVMYKGEATRIIGIEVPVYDSMPYLVEYLEVGPSEPTNVVWIDNLSEKCFLYAREDELTAIEDEPQSPPETPAFEPMYKPGDLVRFNGKVTYVAAAMWDDQEDLSEEDVAYRILYRPGFSRDSSYNDIWDNIILDEDRFPLECYVLCKLSGDLEPVGDPRVGDIVKMTEDYWDGYTEGVIAEVVGRENAFDDDDEPLFYLKIEGETRCGMFAHRFKILPEDAGCYPKDYVSPKKSDPEGFVPEGKYAPHDEPVVLEGEIIIEPWQKPLAKRVVELAELYEDQLFKPDLQLLYQFVCQQKGKLGTARSDADRLKTFKDIQQKLNDELGIPA